MCNSEKTLKYIIALIAFHFIDIPLFTAGLLVIKWNNFVKALYILFIIIMSFNSLYLLFAIFLFISHYVKSIEECYGKIISLFCCITICLIFITDLVDICWLADSIAKINYPCRKEEETGKSENGYNYYYVYYYYLRRLNSDINCTDLPEDYYTGIVTKKESNIAYAALAYSLISDILKLSLWVNLMQKIDNYNCGYYGYPRHCCDCDCDCCPRHCCDCDCSCFSSICHKKKEVEMKKTEPNDIGNNQRVNVEVAVQNSNEPIKEEKAFKV